MLSGEIVRFVLSTILSDIILPSADTYSDIRMVASWYGLGSNKYATALLIPMLIKYLMTWCLWWRIEKEKKKKWTWAFVLFDIWTQAKGCKIIITCRNISQGKNVVKKLRLENMCYS